MKKLCIYHGGCVDGLMAAAVIECANPENVEFYAAKYNTPAPMELIKDREVIIVDFSYPRETMLEISSEAISVLVLDHHKTAQEALAGLEAHNMHIVFDMEKSGAGLAWDYFYPESQGEFRSRLISMVEDRDLWRFKIVGSKQMHYALCAQPMSPQSFASLLGKESKESMFVDFLLSQGNAMESQFMSQLDVLKKEAFERVIEGDKVMVANVPYIFASELAGELAEGRPFAATYYFNGKEFVFSLRSRKETGRDVSEIAKKFGGGGHKNAAGFKLDQNQINVLLKEAA